jgi:16S rRNA processing protein RimM
VDPRRPVTLAAIAGAHGVGGEVKLKLFTGDLSPYKSFTALTVPRDTLPPLGEGEYYHADLIGLPTVSTDGAALGHVVAVENFGAGDVLEIERPDKKRFMVPMRPDAVPVWGERVVIDAGFVV